MIGPNDVIKLEVFGRKSSFNPLRIGTVDKTFRAVTQGTGFSTGITSNTTAGLLLKKPPSIRGRFLFKILDIWMNLNERNLLYRIANQYIYLHWGSMGAYLTGRIKEIIPFQDHFKIIPLHHYLIPLFSGPEDFSFYGPLHLSSIHHPLARHTDQKDLIRFEPLFKRKGSNRTSITSFDDNAYFETTELVKVSSQIILTE
jgi:hypothetical protein